MILGCESSGLSYRESRGMDQGSYLAALQPDGPTQVVTPQRFRAPANLAVAQIGEVAPPQAMLDELRKAPTLFQRVQPIPAVGGPQYAPEAVAGARRQIDSLRAIAGSTGADYLLLLGGTVDTAHTPNALAPLDITIVGLYLVPGHETRALMKASGAIVDVRTGQIVSISSAELQDHNISTYMAGYGRTLLMINAMRDRATVDLAHAIVRDCSLSASMAVPLPLQGEPYKSSRSSNVDPSPAKAAPPSMPAPPVAPAPEPSDAGKPRRTHAPLFKGESK
jgi:hypothetical protein